MSSSIAKQKSVQMKWLLPFLFGMCIGFSCHALYDSLPLHPSAVVEHRTSSSSIQYEEKNSNPDAGGERTNEVQQRRRQQQQRIGDGENVPVTLFYPQNPQKFNDILLDCRADQMCHVMYHHVPKSGGTLIGSRLHPIFDPQERPYDGHDWCCSEKFMKEQFEGNEIEYCTQRGINVLQVFGDQFHHILNTCQTKFTKQETDDDNNDDKGRGHRYVVLLSTREPIQRTLSFINHHCNKTIRNKNAKFQSFCSSCLYDNDHMPGSQFFFNKFADNTNRVYETINIYLQSHSGKEQPSQPAITTTTAATTTATATATRMSSTSISSIPFLVIDSKMLDDWFSELQQNLINRHVADGNIAETAPIMIEGESNLGNQSICDFGMTSTFLKELQPSISIYFDLWRGIV